MTEINPRYQQYKLYRQSVRDLCCRFDSHYWQRLEEQSAYPEEFVLALTEAGCLSHFLRESLKLTQFPP